MQFDEKYEINGRLDASCQYSLARQKKFIDSICSELSSYSMQINCSLEDPNIINFSRTFSFMKRLKNYKNRHFFGLDYKIEVERNCEKKLSLKYKIKMQKKFIKVFNYSLFSIFILLAIGMILLYKMGEHSIFIIPFVPLLMFLTIDFLLPDYEKKLKELLNRAAKKALNKNN
ncbi:hypothetical protein AAEX28_01100 [Lentisphaerota bacterium WC36G]|nr:hypothetical protein LJT99_03980 [Lentisphaerae bacterium WC36]